MPKRRALDPRRGRRLRARAQPGRPGGRRARRLPHAGRRPGLKLDWDAIEGLRETLGRNGVTSNYLFDLAPYTWELVQGLRGGTALFTQPPMPIKCAGAPQKAMYLSCDHWRASGVLADIKVEFHTAGAVLFGVAEFVPPLMQYVERYGAKLTFNTNLTRSTVRPARPGSR